MKLFFDSVLIIAALEGGEEEKRMAERPFARTEVAYASELVVLETLVHPYRSQSKPRIRRFEGFIDTLRIVPIDRRILIKAAELRADYAGLKTPDAIHAATVLLEGHAALVTRDAGFRRVKDLNVIGVGEGSGHDPF